MCRRLIFPVFLLALLGLAGRAWPATVLHYSFDGTLGAEIPSGLVDDTGNYTAEIIEGTDVNTSLTYAESNPTYNPWGTSAEFYNESWSNWAGDTFLIPNEGGFDFTTFDAFTIELFVYPYSAGSGKTRRIFAEEIYAYMYLDGSDTLHAIRKWGPGKWNENWTELTSTNFKDDEWSHLAMTWDANTAGDKFKLYINGKQVAHAPGTVDATLDSTAGFAIGGYQRSSGSTAQFFHGKIDEFRFSDVALDPSEFLFSAETPATASRPDPYNGAGNVDPFKIVSWAPGPFASSHDVYFGTDQTAVADATTSSGEYKGNQDANSYDPGELESGLTYYWRIDEVNEAHLDSPWQGRVWRFTVNDGKASAPDPADEAIRVPLDKALSWTPGIFATTNDVYFGTDFNDVNDATSSNHPNVDYVNTDVNSYDPGALDYFTNYYWRVDSVGESRTWKGHVWGFRAADVVPDPSFLLWYTFDEAEGVIADDSTGHEAHGKVDCRTGPPKWDPDGGQYGGSLAFDDDTAVEVPTYALDDVNDAITVAVWLDGHRDGGDNWVIDAGAGDFHLSAIVPRDGTSDLLWRAGDDANDELTWDLGGRKPADLAGDWNHYVFVKDESITTMQIYFNGLMVAEKTDTSANALANVRNRPFKLGAALDHANDYMGKMDDFRIYDYAMSAFEIVMLFRGGNLGQAWFPTPISGAKDVPWDVVLSWRPGDYAVSHDVYLGTDFNDVNEADTSSDEYKGNQLRDANSYDPSGLELKTTYYWRIDEINDANTDSPWKGKAWNFTVAEYVSIDDMESYCPGEVGGCAIMNNWLDGLENFSGATVKLGVEGTFPVRDQQSMEFSYDNDGEVAGWPADEYSEAELELDPAEDFTDWTILDLKALRLYFYGDPNNDANDTEQMYLGLEDSNGIYVEVRYGDNGEDMNDIRKAEWQQWNIKLSALADAGLELGHVSKIYLGFGDRVKQETGGGGVVYFDDIRLYPRTCVAYLVKPANDLNDDCIVDPLDLEMMAVDWLDSDITFDEMTEPSTDGLVGWWKLDDGSGDTTVDSSGLGNDGTLEGDVSWVAGRDGGSAMECAGGRILVPDAPELRPTDQVTVCAWIYYPAALGEWGRMVVKGADNKESYGLQVNEDDALTFIVRNASNRLYDLDSEDQFGLGEWIHVAGTYDGNSIKSYVNGVVELSETIGAISLSQDPNGLGIGNRSDEPDDPFEGTIDDVRVYSRALSDAELAYLASDGTGLVSMQSPANLHDKESAGDRAVNFKDYAVLIDAWLEQKLWPPEE